MKTRFRPRLEPLESRQLLNAGDLDMTFGGTGKVITPVTNSFASIDCAVLVQPDNKVLVGGIFDDTTVGAFRTVVVRYNADGTLDKGFGAGGIAKGGKAGLGYFGMALQSDGRIVMVTYVDQGTSVKGIHKENDNWSVERLNADGSPDDGSSADTTPGDHFGTVAVGTVKGKSIYGHVYIDFGGSGDRASAVAIQGGKIVVVGVANPSSTTDFAAARLNSDGSLDTTFNGTGKAIGGPGNASAVVIDGSGQVDLTGQSGSSLFVARYTTGGLLDSTFGSGGITTVTVPSYATTNGYSIALQGSSLIVGGLAANPTDPSLPTDQVVITRLTTAGALDTTFGAPDPTSTTGAKTGRFVDPSLTYTTGIAVQPDGKILAVKSHNVSGNDVAFRVDRILADGSGLDATFGSSGLADIDFGTGSGQLAQSVALDSFGRIVVAGSASTFAVARLEGDPQATTTTLASSTNPSTAGQPVTFTATVSAAYGTLTGTVEFWDGTTLLGTGTIVIVNGLATATFTISTLGAGTHDIRAVYGGDSNDLSSSSDLSQVVN